MILVQVQQSWLQVLTGSTTPDQAVLGDWAGIAERDARKYGDVVAGIYRNTVVAVYDVDPEKTTVVQEKTRFGGTPSTKWAHLIGQPNPGEPWGQQGYGRSVQYVDTATVARRSAEIAKAAETAVTQGERRAVVAGFVLTVDANGNASVTVPAGRSLVMHTS